MKTSSKIPNKSRALLAAPHSCNITRYGPKLEISFSSSETHYQCNAQVISTDDEMSLAELLSSWNYWLLFVTFLLVQVGYSIAATMSDTACLSLLGNDNHHRFGQQYLWNLFAMGLYAYMLPLEGKLRLTVTQF